MTRAEDPLKLRRRAESEARFVARTIPDAARVVALVYGAAGAARSAEAAAGIASAVGLRREHTLLAATETGPGTLDELLGGAGRPGLWAALDGRARLTEVALRSERRPYTYLPAGAAPPDPGMLLGSRGLRRLAERAREQGGTLLLHLPERGLAAAARTVDGFIRLGALSRPVPEGLTEYGRVVFREDERPVAAGPRVERGSEEARRASGERDAASEPARPGDGPAPPQDRWRRHRAASELPVVRVALGALAILVLVVGWWALSRESIAGASGPSDAAESAAGSGAVEPPAGSETEAPDGESPGPGPAEADRSAGSTGPPPAGGAEALLERVRAAPELPYSVLIASYARGSDAEDRLRRLTGQGDGLYYVTPTPIRGRVYHRVLAGALGERDTARALMEELVEQGRKEAASAWDVRPVRLAFRLGVYGTRAEAEEAVGEAAAAGVPAYLIPAVAGPDTTFQVYAGGYETESAGRALSALLERAGFEPPLVPRRGVPR